MSIADLTKDDSFGRHSTRLGPLRCGEGSRNPVVRETYPVFADWGCFWRVCPLLINGLAEKVFTTQGYWGRWGTAAKLGVPGRGYFHA
jgi:hypothetical protein